MDTLSPELLHDICACLRIEDVLTFRLVCKVFADIGSAHMLPEVSFYMHQGEFARLREIASHPIVSKHVRSLTYFSEVLDSEKMTFPAYVRAHTVENSNGAWNSFFKRHETPNVPQLRAEYHSYELLMKEQQDIIDNHLDVALLKEIIPKFPSLRQATMSSGDWFYEATTKGRFHDANRDDILLRKVRKSPFDDAPDWTGNQLQPEGKRHLNGLIAGLVSSDCHLESFRAGILDWKFFKSFSRVPDHLAKTLKYLKRLEIHIDTEPRQDVQTIHRCRKAMKSGIMRKLIQPLQHLEVLMVTLYPVEWTADEWPAYLGDIIAPGHTWPNLRELCLGGFKTNRHDLMKFLELHKNSLTHLCLRDVGLGETSWWNLLPDIRNKLKLKEACICGDILGLSEDESAEVPDEFWDLSTPGEHPHHKQRQSINAYCRGPDHYPDDVPLSREVVLRHYDACINDPDASCDEEDVFDDDEVDFDGFGHDYFDFYPEDYIGGFDPDEDMDLVEQMIFAGGMLGFGAPAGFSEGFDPDFDEVDDFDGQQPDDDDDDEEIPDLVDPDID